MTHLLTSQSFSTRHDWCAVASIRERERWTHGAVFGVDSLPVSLALADRPASSTLG
jgi:hypothetical protein